MNIYVESNFVLEVALQQEQHEDCDRIIALCTSQTVRVIIPAYSLIEPYETIIRREKSRKKLTSDFAAEAQQLLRSKAYQPEADALNGVARLLMESITETKRRLDVTIERLLQFVDVIPLTTDIMLSSLRHQDNLGLSPQDALVYASITSHIAASDALPSCFLNRNSRDFDEPGITETFTRYECKMLTRFDHSCSYVLSHLGA